MLDITNEIKKITKSHNYLIGNYVLQVLENQSNIFNLEQDKLQETYNSFKKNFIKSCKEDYTSLKFAFHKQQKSFLKSFNNSKDNITEFTEKCIFKMIVELVVSGETINYDDVETLNLLNYLLYHSKKYNDFKEIFAEIFDDYNDFHEAKERFKEYHLKGDDEYRFIFLETKKEIPDFKLYKDNCIKLAQYIDLLIKHFGYNINKNFVIKIGILIIQLNFKRNLFKDKIALLSGTERFITNLYLELARSTDFYKNKKSFLTEDEIEKYLKKSIYYIIDNMFDGEWFKRYCLIYNYFKYKNIKPLKREIEAKLRKTYNKEENRDILNSKLKCLAAIDFTPETRKYLENLYKITSKLNILIFNDSLTEKDIIKLEFKLAKLINKNNLSLLGIVKDYKETLAIKNKSNKKLILGKLLFYMCNIIETDKYKHLKNNLNKDKSITINNYNLILFTAINYSKYLSKKNKYYYILQNKLIDYFNNKKTESIDSNKISKTSSLKSIFELEFEPNYINYFCFYTIIEKLLKVNDTYYFYRTKFIKEDINYYVFFMTVLFKCEQKEIIKDVLNDMKNNIRETEGRTSEELLLNYDRNPKIKNIEELEEIITSKETCEFLHKLRIKTVFDKIFVSEILKFVKNKKEYNPENVIKRLKKNINMEDIYYSTYYGTNYYLDITKSSIEDRKDYIIRNYFFNCNVKIHLYYVNGIKENPEINYYVNYDDFIYEVDTSCIHKDWF